MVEMLSLLFVVEDMVKVQYVEFIWFVLVLVVVVVVEGIYFFVFEMLVWKFVGMGVVVVVIVLFGLLVFKKGLLVLFCGQFNINVLMSVVVIGVFVIGQWFEVVMVMVLYLLVELIEV